MRFRQLPKKDFDVERHFGLPEKLRDNSPNGSNNHKTMPF
jgi:hypothetical protein